MRIYNVSKHNVGKCIGIHAPNYKMPNSLLRAVTSVVPVQTTDGPMIRTTYIYDSSTSLEALARPGVEVIVFLGSGQFAGRGSSTSPSIILFRNLLWAMARRTNVTMRGGHCPWTQYHRLNWITDTTSHLLYQLDTAEPVDTILRGRVL